jgi:hypothetical protein
VGRWTASGSPPGSCSPTCWVQQRARLLRFLEAEQRRGDARVLAEPTLVAADRDSASFLAGGELPIPIAQPNAGGAATVTVLFREFGVRLSFAPEVLNDSTIRLRVRPEVSSLDYANAITLQGFRIRRSPRGACRRRSTSAATRPSSSRLFNEERQKTRTGIPILMNCRSSARCSRPRAGSERNGADRVVTPSIFDPSAPRPQDTIRFVPDTTLPAREAIQKRLPTAPTAPRRP